MCQPLHLLLRASNAPGHARETLYFKDDDALLSFLQGNYITLTNLTEREAQRIIDLRISPINVSVHTTDPQLHCTMLGNKKRHTQPGLHPRLLQAGIVMNGQIVIYARLERWRPAADVNPAI